MHRSGRRQRPPIEAAGIYHVVRTVFHDHFNKEMLTKFSPTLISVVARKKMGHVVEKIPFYAHTVQRTGDATPRASAS